MRATARVELDDGTEVSAEVEIEVERTIEIVETSGYGEGYRRARKALTAASLAVEDVAGLVPPRVATSGQAQ